MDSRQVITDAELLAAGDAHGWRGVADAVCAKFPDETQNATVWALERLTAQIRRIADRADNPFLIVTPIPPQEPR